MMDIGLRIMDSERFSEFINKGVDLMNVGLVAGYILWSIWRSTTLYSTTSEFLDVNVSIPLAIGLIMNSCLILVLYAISYKIWSISDSLTKIAEKI